MTILALGPIAGPLLWSLISAGAFAAARELPRLWGKKSDAETQLEFQKADKAARREFTAYLEAHNATESARDSGARGQAMQEEGLTGTPLNDVPFAPVPANPEPTTTPHEMTDQSPVAASAASGMGANPKYAALQRMMGTEMMADKLVSAALARGEQPTEFDYAGIIV